MTDRDALLKAVLANPEEDTPRLALADWLDEHGEPDRGEFIRTQIELHRQREAEADLPTLSLPAHGWCGPPQRYYRPTPLAPAARVALLEREESLLKTHAEEWSAGLPKYAGGVEFRRGFVGRVSVPLAAFMKAPAALWK